MEKKKVDIVIFGNMLTTRFIGGGGKIYLQINKQSLQEFFDISKACIIEGDVCVENFNAADKCVVVCGSIATKGGEL